MDKKEELQRCIKILRSGGLIVAPSDTVYGLVCDATNDEAVRKLIAVKNRPFGKPISVFTDGMDMISDLTDAVNHKDILNTLLPGPFTIVLPSKHKVSRLLESERGTLGVRLPRFDWIVQLVQVYGKPLTATSANISGKRPHYEPGGFINELSSARKKQVDYVVDFGKLPRNKPSTIIDLSAKTPKLLRKGDVMPVSHTQYVTTSETETRKTAQYITAKYSEENPQKPIIFVLQGEMGAGKTIFAKGIGDMLGISDVVSPTYVIYYEYKTNRSTRPFFLHVDLFNIEENAEFNHLGLESYFTQPNVICIEWGNKAGTVFDAMKRKGKVIFINILYTGEKERKISVSEL